MPKMKTHSASKKRFKKLKSGLIKRSKQGKRHILTKKNRKTKRNLRKGTYVNKSDMSNIAPLLPY